MKFSTSLVSFALIAGLGIGTAMAQDSGNGAPSFSDLSKDGKSIKRSDIPKDSEPLKQLRTHFTEADLNHDGKVDKSEYDAYLAKGSQHPSSSN